MAQGTPHTRLSRNTVPCAIFPNTLPREEGVYWIIWSLQIISCDRAISSLLPVNTKKYIPGGLGGKDDPDHADPTKQHSGTSPGENVTKSEGQPQLHRQCQHVQVFLNLLSNPTTHHPLFSSASVVWRDQKYLSLSGVLTVLVEKYLTHLTILCLYVWLVIETQIGSKFTMIVSDNNDTGVEW